MSSKKSKRLAVVWSCLFILQEFNVVLLLNIDEMRALSTTISDVTEWNSRMSSGSTSRQLRKIMDALRSLGNRFKEKNASIVENVKFWLTDCESNDEKAAYNFWKDNPSFSFVYILISSVLFYIAECDAQMEQRAKELVDLLGSKMTIEFIKVLAEFDDVIRLLNDTEHFMEKSPTQEQESGSDVNFDRDVLSNLTSNVLDLLTINLFNTGEINGIFNAFASNFTIGNETELEEMLQYTIESAVEEIMSGTEDSAETETRGLTAKFDTLQTPLKYDQKKFESQKSMQRKNVISSALNILKSQLSPVNNSRTIVKRNHTPTVSIKTLRSETLNAYQGLFEKDYSTESIGIPMRRKRATGTQQYYIMYLSTNPCFVMTSSKESNFSIFKRFSNLEEQKWKYELKHLINSKTSRAVSVNSFSGYFEHVMMLEEPDWDGESQSWNIINKNRLVHTGRTDCKLDIQNGYVSVYCSDSNPLVEIEVVPHEEYQRIHWQAECDNIDSHEFFFLKQNNSAHACKVLTVTGQKEHLTYQEVYDRDIAWQLWRISNNHLVNKGSGLILYLTKSGLELFDLNRITELEKSTTSRVWHDSLHITLIKKEVCKPVNTNHEYDYDIEYKDKDFDFKDYLYSMDEIENADQSICQDQHEMNMTWIYVDLESARNDLERISCFYIISNAKSPCELLIVDEANSNTLILSTPEMEQMDQGAGLWYYSENHLVHAGTGLVLTAEIEIIFSAIGLTYGIVQRRVEMDENQLWLWVGREILTFDSNMLLTMKSQATDASTSEWLVSERRAVVVNDTRKGCGDYRPFQDLYEDNEFYDYGGYDEETTQRYFVRNKANTCKFLTVSGPTFPNFEYFSTHEVEKYIWTIKKNVIMHENSRLVLSFINSGSHHLDFITLEQFNASDSFQEWVVHENLIISKQFESCEIGLFEPNSDLIGLFCDKSDDPYKEWDFIPVSEHTEIKDLICPFFLRNDDKHCFFLTHLDRSDVVIAMPMYPKVINSQLWYWDGSQIKGFISGKYLSVSNRDDATLLVSGDEGNIFMKNWILKQKHLSPFNDLSMHVEKQPDGTIRLRERNNDDNQVWSMLIQKDLELNSSVLHCDNPDDEEVFLITSDKFPCVVLTSVRANEPPIFIPFADSIMADQLWWWNEGALVNIGTRMYLIYNSSDDNKVLMVQKDALIQGISRIEFRSNSFFVHNGADILKLRATWNRDDTIFLSTDYTVNASTEDNFQLLKLNNLDKNMDRLVCTYLIRSNLFPCQYLTGKGNLMRVMVEPVSDEMIEDQIWFWQESKLIHARTGLMLSISESDRYLVLRPDANSTWVKSKYNMIQGRGLISRQMWEVDPTSEGAIKLENPSYLPNQQWTFLRTGESLPSQEMLECPDKSSGNQALFFLKNMQYPCVLLTATDESKYPKFQHLNSASIETQLWYQENNNIINVGSGFALRALPNRKVDLWHRNAFKMDQAWWVTKENRILSPVNRGICLGFSQSIVPLQLSNCNDGLLSQQWEWVPMENVENVTCFYFIRNELEPCEFLTGSIENTAVSVKPLVHDLMENQMWYWNATRLVHFKTKLDLSIENGTVVIQSSKSALNGQFWEYHHSQNSINVLNDSLNAVTMNPEENGLLYITPYYQSRTQKWKFYEVVSSLQDIDHLFCPVDESAPTALFFIVNDDVPCHVLTARQKRQPPEFIHFSEEIISQQLWYMNGESIVNSATSLALDIDHAMGSQVVLNDHFAFAKSQKWMKDDNFIVSKEDVNCVLNATRATPRIPISYCARHGGPNQWWSFVLFDDSFSNFEKVVCLTFVQNRKAPCELLTGFRNNEEVRTRPVSQDLISSQVWFWSGDKLINANTGLALDMENSNSGAKIILRDKGNFITQNWKQELYFIRSMANNYVVDLDVSRGDVITWFESHGGPNQQWYFVKKDDGLQNVDLLYCAKKDSPKIYFLKSEHDPCPLLTHEGYDRISMRKIDTNAPNKQLWFWIENHIVNVESGKALSLRNSWFDGAPVVLEIRYAFERYQQWARSNGRIQSLFKDQSKALDFTDDALMIYHSKEASTQMWTWLTTEDVNKDGKLLRCAHCYDRSEEKAAEIISFIPIFSTIYNTIRAGVYAGKGCEEVALEALQSALIDIAIDVAIALSAGTAAAAAYGIKTGIKLGVKAGIKAAASAIKASIKVSVNAVKIGLKAVLEKGIASAIKQQVKKSILSLSNVLKSSFKAVKNIPIVAKTVLNRSWKNIHFAIRSLKATSISLKSNLKRLNMLRKSQGLKASASYLVLSASKAGKSLAHSISNKMVEIGKAVKSKLKQIGDTLAEEAEKNIRLAKRNGKDYTRLTRCKRMLSVCGLKKSGTDIRKETISRANDDAKYLHYATDISSIKATKVIEDDMAKMKLSAGISENLGEEFAVVGLRNPATRNIDDVSLMSVSDIRGKDPRPPPLGPDMKPVYLEGAEVKATVNVQHAEQFLLENKLNVKRLEECSKLNSPCEIFLYTKYSPCISHGRSDALSCMDYLSKKCTELHEKYHIKCIVGFEQWWGDSPPWLDDVEVKKALTGDANAIENLKKTGLSGDTLDSINAFLSNDINREKVVKKFQDIFRDARTGENRFNSIYVNEFAKNKYAFTGFERKELQSIWTDLNEKVATEDLEEFKKSVLDSFNQKFGAALKTSEEGSVVKYMQDVDDFLTAHPVFNDKTLNLELIGKIEDKNLKTSLKEWSKTERPKEIHEIRGELSKKIINCFESAREFKAGYSSKAFSIYLDDTFGESARKIIREELAIKKTIDTIQKIKHDETIIEFFHLG
ncbi:hypothetical protein CHS0354_001799 [Potamilus streckersoni]|uniref:Ricin B lectin domain-containing protein n=1 Tax=Potamilus streckersoni TaxID=2493646 RepID=A0AAE0S4V1_9BIVA|nr:hypothetical protein CHS0354_001799 [Potamilus streckersoni]